MVSRSRVMRKITIYSLSRRRRRRRFNGELCAKLAKRAFGVPGYGEKRALTRKEYAVGTYRSFRTTEI